MAAILERASIMPIDTLFALSSSPPVSYFTSAESLLYQRTTARDLNPSFASTTINTAGLFDVSYLSNGMFTNTIKPRLNGFSGAVPNMVKANQPLRSCLRVKVEQNGDDGSLNSSSESSSDPTSPNSPTENVEGQMDRLRISEQISPVSSPKYEKKVVFADSKGLPLETVQLLEQPGVPPLLDGNLMKHIIQDAKPDPEHPYTYVADFEQPASSYLEFRERIEFKCVSLENVMIRDNIKVIGTAKVKNIAFEKDVTVRVTFDGWRTAKEVVATYVPQSNVTASRYDTFSFEFDIPPNQGGKEFEFCINYSAPGVGGSYWDNNDGKNYRIVSQERRGMTPQQKIESYHSLSGHYNWGDFSYWKTASDETPYWWHNSDTDTSTDLFQTELLIVSESWRSLSRKSGRILLQNC